jgi:hypothetical protein
MPGLSTVRLPGSFSEAPLRGDGRTATGLLQPRLARRWHHCRPVIESLTGLGSTTRSKLMSRPEGSNAKRKKRENKQRTRGSRPRDARATYSMHSQRMKTHAHLVPVDAVGLCAVAVDAVDAVRLGLRGRRGGCSNVVVDELVQRALVAQLSVRRSDSKQNTIPPTCSSPVAICLWYLRRSESTSSMLCCLASPKFLMQEVISLTWSSVSSRPSCSTRDLMAFQPCAR